MYSIKCQHILKKETLDRNPKLSCRNFFSNFFQVHFECLLCRIWSGQKFLVHRKRPNAIFIYLLFHFVDIESMTVPTVA